MRAIPETIAPELGEVDEADRNGLMREIRAIYGKDDSNDSVLKSFMGRS